MPRLLWAKFRSPQRGWKLNSALALSIISRQFSRAQFFVCIFVLFTCGLYFSSCFLNRELRSDRSLISISIFEKRKAGQISQQSSLFLKIIHGRFKVNCTAGQTWPVKYRRCQYLIACERRGFFSEIVSYNSPFPNYAPVPVNKGFRSKQSAIFSSFIHFST